MVKGFKKNLHKTISIRLRRKKCNQAYLPDFFSYDSLRLPIPTSYLGMRIKKWNKLWGNWECPMVSL